MAEQAWQGVGAGGAAWGVGGGLESSFRDGSISWGNRRQGGRDPLTPAGAPVAGNSGRLGVGWGEGSPGHWLEWGDSLEG